MVENRDFSCKSQHEKDTAQESQSRGYRISSQRAGSPRSDEGPSCSAAARGTMDVFSITPLSGLESDFDSSVSLDSESGIPLQVSSALSLVQHALQLSYETATGVRVHIVAHRPDTDAAWCHDLSDSAGERRTVDEVFALRVSIGFDGSPKHIPVGEWLISLLWSAGEDALREPVPAEEFTDDKLWTPEEVAEVVTGCIQDSDFSELFSQAVADAFGANGRATVGACVRLEPFPAAARDTLAAERATSSTWLGMRWDEKTLPCFRVAGLPPIEMRVRSPDAETMRDQLLQSLVVSAAKNASRDKRKDPLDAVPTSPRPDDDRVTTFRRRRERRTHSTRCDGRWLVPKTELSRSSGAGNDHESDSSGSRSGSSPIEIPRSTSSSACEGAASHLSPSSSMFHRSADTASSLGSEGIRASSMSFGESRRSFLVGSFEDSVLRDVLHCSPSTVSPGWCLVVIGQSVRGRALRVRSTFTASRYEITDGDHSPWIGTPGLDDPRALEGLKRVSALQFILVNPEGTPLKMLRLPYDASSLSPRTRAMACVRVYERPPFGAHAPWLRFAVRVQLVCDDEGTLRLGSRIRAVFAGQIPDEDAILDEIVDQPSVDDVFPLAMSASPVAPSL